MRETYAHEAYGEVVWSRRCDAGVKLRWNYFRAATEAKEPFSEESSK